MTRPSFVSGGAAPAAGFQTNTSTVSLAVGTGTNRVCFAVFGSDAVGADTASATFDGNAMTSVQTWVLQSRRMALYYYAIPDGVTGTKDIIGTMTSGDTHPGIAAGIWQDAAASPKYSGVTTAANGSFGTSHSLAIASDATNGLAVVFGHNDAGVATTASAGTTKRTSEATGSFTHEWIFEKDGAGTTTLNWTTASGDVSSRIGFSIDGVTSSGPVITIPTGTPTGPTQATIGITSDTAPTTTAISYQILPAATAAPSAATIVGAPDGTISTGSAGALTKAITGLTTNTAVKVHFAQGASSNVASSASFTPNTLAIAGTALTAQSVVTGAALTWAGATPESLITNTGNGTPGTAWTATAGVGASGATVDASTGILVVGTAGTVGAYTITLQRTDASTVPAAQTVTKSVTLNVAALPTITTDPLEDETGAVLASTTIAKLAAVKLSDVTVTCTWTNQTTNGSGVLSLSHASLTAVPHLLLTSSSDGADAGAKVYTPA